jgi:hypothetical protein
MGEHLDPVLFSKKMIPGYRLNFRTIRFIKDPGEFHEGGIYNGREWMNPDRFFLRKRG